MTKTQKCIWMESKWLENLPSSLSFVEVNIHAFQLERIVTNISSGGVNAVLGGHDLNKMMHR